MKICQIKTCDYQGTSQPIENFNRDASRKSGRQRECKSCRNKRNKAGIDKNSYLKRTFGISLSEYERMLSDQEHKCLTCLRHSSKFKARLAVDHDHKTGKIRGLLCTDCNLSLGRVLDDVDTLARMIAYLKKS